MKKSTLKLTGIAKGAILALMLSAGASVVSAQTFLHEGIVYKASGSNLKVILPTHKDNKPENGEAPTDYTGDVVIPETIEYKGKTYNVTELGNGFKETSITSIKIGNKVKKATAGCFQKCPNLVKVEFGTGMTELVAKLFNGATALKEITIPANITKIASNAFQGCTGLEKITLLEGEPFGLDINMFSDGAMDNVKEVYIYRAIDPEKAVEMAVKPFRAAKSLEKVVLGGNVKSVPASYFENASKLKSLTIESALEEFGTSVFAGTAIEEVTLPEALTSVSSGLFANSKQLRKVTFGANVKTIESLAFKGCSALSEINLPEALTSIGEQAFSGTNLSGQLVLPASFAKLGAQAFANAAGLKSVSIPAATTTVGDGAFMGCAGLEKIEVAADNESLASDGVCLTSKDATRVLALAPMGGRSEFSSEAATEIAPYAFYGVKTLEKVNLPAVNVFGDYSFASTGIKELAVKGLVGRYVAQNCPELTTLSIEGAEIPLGIAANCPKLSTVNLPERLTVVKSDAFKNCTEVKSLNLGGYLAILEADCFVGSGIEALTVASTFPPAMAEGVFTEASSNIELTVPVELVDAYKAADGWKYLNVKGDANLAAQGADMGMPAGLYYAGTDNMLHCVYSDGKDDTYDVGGIPHTFQLLEYSNRIYGACAGKKFIYSATGATDGDGKLFYISKVGGNVFQAVVLDNAGNNAYKDPFGLYLYGETLYVNDRNVAIRKIPASAIALPQDYPSWVENNWMNFYGTLWSYGCIKSGFAITQAEDQGGNPEPLYWVGMKYNGNGLFCWREANVGTGTGEGNVGSKPAEEPMLTGLAPIFTTFNIDEKHGHLYIYVEKMGSGDNAVLAGLYRVNVADIMAKPNPTNFINDLKAVLIDGSPVKYEGGGANEHVGISQLAIDANNEYMYWCYRAPDAEEAAKTENPEDPKWSSEQGHYPWAEKYDATNPLHQSGIKRIKLGEANPVVEMVVPGVEGYGVAAVNFAGSSKPSDGVNNVVIAQPELVNVVAGAVVANEAVEIAAFNAAGLLVARASLAEGETYTFENLEAGVYVVVASAEGTQQVVKVAK